MLVTIILIILILMLVGALPQWGYAPNYGPSGAIGLILIILLILLLVGRI